MSLTSKCRKTGNFRLLFLWKKSNCTNARTISSISHIKQVPSFRLLAKDSGQVRHWAGRSSIIEIWKIYKDMWEKEFLKSVFPTSWCLHGRWFIISEGILSLLPVPLLKRGGQWKVTWSRRVDIIIRTYIKQATCLNICSYPQLTSRRWLFSDERSVESTIDFSVFSHSSVLKVPYFGQDSWKISKVPKYRAYIIYSLYLPLCFEKWNKM